MDNQTTIGRLQPSEQAAQQCFIAHSYNAPWHPTIVEVCQEVLPRFGLQPWYADEHFDTTIPLREKVVEMIATTRYGIYDLSYWKSRGSTQWEMPRNVLIELGMAIALNRPMLLLRHAENEVCNIALPACLQGIEQICTFTGATTLRKALETSLPQWIHRSPEREWRNRYCNFGNLVCSYREEHPKRQWNQRTLQCHISDGDDLDRVDFRETVEDTLHQFSDVTFTYLGAGSLPSGYNFLLCSHCQQIRSSPFAIYRITEKTSADTFIAIGMSIAVEFQCGYKIPKIFLTTNIQHIPSLLRGYEVIVAQNDSKIRRRLSKFLPQVIQQVRKTTWKPKILPFEVFVPQQDIPVISSRQDEEAGHLEPISENVEQLKNDSEAQEVAPSQSTEESPPLYDFFIHYQQADQNWAEWIAWQLETAGYTCILKSWIFSHDPNFLEETDAALQLARHTIILVSSDYVDNISKQREWQSVFIQDSINKRYLLPIRIEECMLPESLSSIVYINLVDIDARSAQRALLAGISRIHVKPSQSRRFPVNNPPPFPDRRRLSPVESSVTSQSEQKAHKPINVFISYARDDDRFRERLIRHLRPMERHERIEIWDDSYIIAGVNRGEEISRHINSADVILLLLSADFFASDKCYAEMKQVLDRREQGEVAVIPILIRSVSWKNTPVESIQALPANGKPVSLWDNIDEAFVEIVRAINKVIEDLQSNQ